MTGFVLLVATCTAAVAFTVEARAEVRSGPVRGRPAPERLEPWIARAAASDPSTPVVAWVYFTDRAGAEHDPAAWSASLVSPRALDRRARRGVITGPRVEDLPVHEPYVRALVARGARLRGTSRWLDAASVELPASLAVEIARLPFVARVERVPVGIVPHPVDLAALPESATPGAASAAPAQVAFAPGDTAYYGRSFRQLAMMQVPQLHKAGLTGAGVLVCMLDAGYRTTHVAFSSLHVLARRDFVHGDTTVDDIPGQDTTGQASHGTMTLGCLGGSQPGAYSGVAFGATFALGKTEWVPTETPVEMDHWQFGAEWADSLGADIISSSLGYSVFDAPWPSYTYADMNGHTTVVAKAAAEAARLGITVVNAAGNEGANSWRKIISPADADSIVSVGAVDSMNVVTSFSSRGPTSDGRIKPDVTAMGTLVVLPSFNDPTKYTSGAGTSFSCPLTAGVVALLLEAHPNWSPYIVRDALRSTALNHASPDTIIGWGLVQAAAANEYVPTTGVTRGPDASTLSLAAGPNPLRRGGALAVRFAAPPGARVTLELLDVTGRRRTLFAGTPGADGALRWDGRDATGRGLPAGVYWLRLASPGARPVSRSIALVP